MRKTLQIIVLATAVQFTAMAQEHKLPPELKAERQAQGLLEDMSKTPEVFEFKKFNTSTNKSSVMDESTWLPGEFDESDAVAISWANTGNRADTTGNLAIISSKLCIAIQPEAKVLIRINTAEDSLLIKRYMQRINEPLYNYGFIIKPLNAWWYRDFGPIGYYSGPNDSLIFADFKYYLGRQHDDVIPATHAFLSNVGHRITPMRFEGGNLIADGFGSVTYSSVVQSSNAGAFIHYPTLNAAGVADSMADVLQASRITQLPALNCDGGTGHLDLYLKMFDEETWIAAQYPLAVTASDRQLIENNVALLSTQNSIYGRPYRIIRVPLPTDDNGTYNNQRTCTQLNNFGRSFVNGITVNKTFIYPIWDNPNQGNTAQRLEFEEYLKKKLPGYKLYGIDVRAMTGFGGQLHCITMQIPTADPVRIWHPAVRDGQPLQPAYHLVARIKNKNGIAGASFNWRRKGEQSWNVVQMNDSAGFYVGDIEDPNFAVGDTIQYFIETATNAGKIARKPIVAPEGYFEFFIMNITSTTDILKSAQLTFYPNPTAGEVKLTVSGAVPGKYDVVLRDMSGRMVKKTHLGTATGTAFSTDLNMEGLSKGLYFAEVLLNGQHFAIHKISKI